MSRLAHIFRSKSDSSVKPSPLSSPAVSPANSPRGSPQTARRRRFVRVVRDNDHPGEEYENPNVVRKYSTLYWENCQKQAKKLNEDGEKGNVPYTVSGHTILKKQHSRDDSGDHLCSATSTPHRHAFFRDEVQVIEFDRKNKVEECTIGVHSEQLLFTELIAGEPDFTVPANCSENSFDEDDKNNMVEKDSMPVCEGGLTTSKDNCTVDNPASNNNKKDEDENDDTEIALNKFSRLTAVDGLIVKSLKKLKEDLSSESEQSKVQNDRKADRHIRFDLNQSDH